MRITRPTILCTLAVLAIAAATASPAGAAGRGTTTAPYRVEAATPKGQAAVEEVTAVLVAPQGIDPNYTPEDVATRLSQADAYYANETHGRVHINAASISDWQVPDDPNVRCDDFASINAFALQYSGFTPGPDKHLMAMVPESLSCERFSNASEGEGVNDGGFLFIDADLPTTISHELGHNMSLFHASSVQCSDAWDYDEHAMPASCARDEYGNDADLMGHAYTFLPFTAGTLDRLGLISHRVVPTCGAARRVTISTMSSGFDAQRIISWADPRDPSVSWFVQYRDVVDGQEYANVYDSPAAPHDVRPSGVQLSRTDPLYPEATSIAVRPGDTSEMAERLVPGDEADLRHGMSVRVVSMDEDAHRATVDVTVPCGAGGRTVEPLRSTTPSMPTGAIMQQAVGMPPMWGADPTEASDAMAGMDGMSGMASMSGMSQMPAMTAMPGASTRSDAEFPGPRWNVARILRLPS
ncbi:MULTISPECIES: hypothetical protein [Clavibacter]|uniref:Peptidase M11 gametolysin domain-containing protein n=1 Tax=Clavibacter tessellarius TaxID=31965 RepID=A0A154V1J1_9MICO|nr:MULTISPECIES: hypothetical protein [Clavibacter]KZC95235.1 hypothetical protein AWH51_08810 [Clavibacter michiganensis subsp. tessellarius]MDA3803920.1 hypothetical protein [Clavibacter sp. CT19]